jgi:6-phosphofructokinase
MASRNAFYAQSGGVTAVINASACGVIDSCRKHSDKIGALYAGQNGIIGALQENLIDTSVESDQSVDALRHIPGCAFGSCRYKMSDIADSDAEYQRLIEVFKAHNIGYFFIMAVVIQLIPVSRFRKFLSAWATQYRLFTFPKP